MTQTSMIERRAFAAEYQAKAALRAGRRGDAEGFAVAANRMYDVLESSPFPYLTTLAMVQMVGRAKAMVLKIERPLINAALCANPTFSTGFHAPGGPKTVGELIVL